MMKRSGKFYRRNEEEVMTRLGFKPTKNSGSGWIEKEDGQSEYAICQLKSTDARSIKVNLKDIHTLEYNAEVSHKVPVFAIQFLETDEVFLIVKPDDLVDLSTIIEKGKVERLDLGLQVGEFEPQREVKKIRSSSRARDEYMQNYNKKFKKERKSAK